MTTISDQSRLLHVLTFLMLAALTLITVVAALVGYPPPEIIWQVYLIPIFLASHLRGPRWGALVAILTSLLLIPSLLVGAEPRVLSLPDVYALAITTIFFLLVAVLVGRLARVRIKQDALSQTVRQLSSWLDKGLSVDELLPILLEQAMVAYRAGGGLALRCDRESLTSRVVSAAGSGSTLLKRSANEAELVSALCALGNHRQEPFPAGIGELAGVAATELEQSDMASLSSLLMLPFQGRAGMLCLLVLVYDKPAALRKTETDVARVLVSRSLPAIENAFLHEEIKEQASRLSVTNKVASVIATSLDLRRTIRSILESMAQSIPGATPALFIYHQDSRQLQMEAFGAADSRPLRRAERETVQRFAEEVAATGSPVWTGHESFGTPDAEPPGMDRPMVSFIGVPLVVSKRMVGVACFWAGSAEMLAKRDLDFLSNLAPHIAASINNAQLYHTTDSALAMRVQELSVIQAVGRELNSTLDLDHLLNLILDKVVELTHPASGHIVLTEEEAVAPHHPSWFSRYLSPGSISGTGAPAISTGTIEQLASGGEPVVSVGFADDGQSYRKKAYIPIMWRGSLLGVILLETEDPSAFEAGDLSFLLNLANQAAPAIENARLFRGIDRKAHDTALLLETSTLVSSTLSLDHVLQYLAQSLVASLNMAFCTITLLDEAQRNLTVRASFHAGRDHWHVENGFSFPVEQARWHCRVVRTRQLVTLPEDGETVELSGVERDIAADTFVTSSLLAPLIVGDRVVGVIFLGERRSRTRAPVTPDKLNLCRAMAAQAAVAVEKARLYQAALEEKRSMEYIFRSMGDGVCTTDSQQRIITFNPAAERITGWKSEEAIGRHCCEVLKAVAGEGTPLCSDSCPVQSAIESRQVVQSGPLRLCMSRRGRKPVYIASSAAPLRSPNGIITGAVVVFRDMSHEEELNQMKSTFISMVSHELKSPLSSISAASELLLSDGEEQPQKRDLLGIIHRQTETLSQFIENVLNASFLQDGNVDVDRHPVSIRALLDRVVNNDGVDAAGHRVETRVPEELPLVLADARKVEVVVRNLLQNAVKYSAAGSRVLVEAERQVGAGVVVSVSDEGIGIPGEYLARIFERFYRVSGDESQRVTGCGLGLYIAKALVEANGGKIWVSSIPGVGSRFSFSIPEMPETSTDCD